MSAHIWHVEGSLPPEEGRHWRKNINVTVCADSLMAAAKAVAARFDGSSYTRSCGTETPTSSSTPAPLSLR